MDTRRSPLDMLGHNDTQPRMCNSSSCTSTSTCPSILSSSSEPLMDSKMFRSLEELADFCAYVVNNLFESSDSIARNPCASAAASVQEVPTLTSFIRYALYRTRLNDQIPFHALFLLHRLKSRYPSAKGTNSSPHRLFLAALILSSKTHMDDTYSNKSWAIVGQSMFTLREINCMERELFGYLDFALVVHRERLDAFVAYWAYEWALRSPPGTTGLPTRASSPNSSSSDTFDSNSRFTAGVKRRLSASANAPASEERHRDKMAALAAHSLLRPTFQPLSVPIQAQFSNSNSQSSWSTSERPMWAHRASDDNTSMSSSQCPSPYFQPTDGSSSSSSSEISTPVMTSPDQSVDTPYTDMPCAKTIAHDLSQAKAIQDLYHTLMPCPQWASPV